MTLYHGSQEIIEKPEFGKGKPHNDYGVGFYCTDYLDRAQEWACAVDHDGYANQYELNLEGLRVLDLTEPRYYILHWMSILLRNRKFTISFPIARRGRDYLLEHFPVETEGVDVIKGYRANDSYFSYARDFLSNTISVERLARAMKLGNLGLQTVLVSPKAFANIRFIDAIPAPCHPFHELRQVRDKAARDAYFSARNESDLTGLYLMDIMRDNVRNDDVRLR